MKASELRIGNFVRAKSPEKKEWVECHKISAHTLYSMVYPAAMDFVKPDMEAIPLTEEWALRMGFEEIYRSDFQAKYSIEFDRSDIHISFRSNGDIDVFANNHLLPKCKSVHQLQNLCFALSDEELTVRD